MEFPNQKNKRLTIKEISKKLKFKTNNFFTSENIKIATESQVYLSDIGITSLPSDKINIRLDYEQ